MILILTRRLVAHAALSLTSIASLALLSPCLAPHAISIFKHAAVAHARAAEANASRADSAHGHALTRPLTHSPTTVPALQPPPLANGSIGAPLLWLSACISFPALRSPPRAPLYAVIATHGVAAAAATAHASCDRFVSSAFGWLGWKAATYPLAFLGFSFFFGTLCALGYFSFATEASPDMKYTPYNSELFTQRAKIAQTGFGHPDERVTRIIVEHTSLEKSDIFSPAYLYPLFQLRGLIATTTVAVNGASYSFTDLCVRGASIGALGQANISSALASECSVQGPTDMWSNDQSLMTADPNLYATMFSSAAPVDATGRAVRTEDVVSARSYSSGTGAAGYQFTIRLRNSPSPGCVDSNSATDPPYDCVAAAWERALKSTLQSASLTSTSALTSQSSGKVYSTSFDGFRVWVLSPELIRHEQALAWTEDQPLLVLCYFLVWFYVCGVFYRRNWVRSRMGMALVSMATVGLSLAAGVGACAGMGLMFSSDMILLSIFILTVGIGDSCVLMACIQPFEPSWRQATPFALSQLASKVRSRFWWIRSAEIEGVEPMTRQGRMREGSADGQDDEEKGRWDREQESVEGGISAGVAAAGPFITVTSMTISTSLVIGAYTILPAFRSFCVHACVCVIFLWIFHFTFFLPLLSIDAQRQNAHRCDAPCCCCPPVEGQGVEEKLCAPTGQIFDENDSSVCGSWFGTRCLKAVLSPVGTLAIVMCFVTLLSFSIYGCTTLTSVIELDTVRLPRRSPEAAAAWNAQQELFHAPNVVRPLVRIYSVQSGADYFASMAALDALNTQLSLNTFILSGSVQFWWPAYLSFLANNAPYNIAANGLVTSGKPASTTVFTSSLLAFLNTAAGAQYWEDIVPLNAGLTPNPANPLGGGLRAFRVGFRIAAADSSADEARAMDAMRGLTGGTTFSALPLFSYHPHYAALEGQKDLIWEVTRHLLISGATILLALLFLLANLWAAVSVAFALAITVLEVVGLLALSGLPVSPDSAMPCLVWLALSVGFFTHSTQGFLRCQGLRPYRAFKSMQKIGGCVVDYICVLFLAVLLLAAARTQALFVAFESLALLATLGVFNGLLVWPNVLAYLGPSTSFNAEITLTQIDSNPITEFRSTAVASGPADASRPGGHEPPVRDPANPFTGQEDFQPRPVKPVQGVEMMQQSRQQPAQPSLYDHNTEPEIEPPKRSWNPHDPANQVQHQPSLRTPQKPAGKWM